MLRFDPPELQQQISAALEKLADPINTIVSHQWYRMEEEDFDPNDPEFADDDIVITADTEVDYCRLVSSDDCIRATVRDLISWADLLSQYKLKDRSILCTDTKALVYVEGVGPAEYEFARLIQRDNLEVSQRVRIEGRDYRAKLVVGFTPFAVFIEAEGANDEHVPSYFETATFVEITHPENASDSDVMSVVRAFLFEIASSTELSFEITHYPVGPDSLETEDDAPDPSKLRLRLLRVGKGLNDLHQLYVAGCHANPVEYALIHFVKIIEYVSATVVRMTRHEALRRRLDSKAALEPDAAFLDDLADLFEQQRIFSKDAEAIKLTIQTCCDPMTIAKESPRYLEQLRRLKETDDPKAKRTALEEFSSSLTATRNQLSHAKANYLLTGEECPADQLDSLTSAARVAADEVIRWFARLPETSRVV